MLKNLFLISIKFLFAASVRVISPFTTTYVSLKLHKSDRSIDVLHLICLLGLYLQHYLTDHELLSIF